MIAAGDLGRAAAEKVDPERVVALARDALRIPSISGEEADAARYFHRIITDAGMTAVLQPVPASPTMGASWNALGYLKGDGSRPSLLFSGHIDHNPVSNGWTRDPFGGIVEDGWLFGFVHMKAACACYVAAVEAVREAGIALGGDVTLANVCGELRGGVGTRHALAEGLTADCFILGEPTELQLATCHTASHVAKIHIVGRSKHFATEDTPQTRGVNAVEQAARIISALGGSHQPLPAKADGGFLDFQPVPGFEGLPQLNVGPIHGGISRSYDATRPALFPDVCTITIDFRIVPGMTRNGLERDLTDFLGGFRAAEPLLDWKIEWAAETFPLPFSAPADSPVVRAVADAHDRLAGRPPGWSKVLKFAASDASWMQAAGIPGVIYGPTGRYLSRPDERCETADLVLAAKVYAAVIADLCGLS